MRCIFVSVILASCVGYSMQSCGGEIFGKGVQVCTASDGHELQPGEKYISYEYCSRCECMGTPSVGLRMKCCGIGINAGTFGLPVGCKVIKGDKCEALLVKETDETMPCN